MFFLDTNTCIYFMKGKSQNLQDKLLSTPPNLIGIPAIVKAELLLGACKSMRKETALKLAEAFLAPFETIPFDDGACRAYAEIRAGLESAGKSIGPNDLLIAATALSRRAALITRNTAEFSRVAGLGLEDWY